MRVRDFVQPLPEEAGDRAIRDVLPWLCRGTAVVIRGDTGWRYIRPADALMVPASRQLCDVPSHALTTVDVNDEIDVALLSSEEILGATRNHSLVGGVACARVLAESAQLMLGTDCAALGVTARERLMPKFLHDISNALSVATLLSRAGSFEPHAVRAMTQSIDHVTTLVHQMRGLYTADEPCTTSLDLCDLLRDLVPMLQVAASPAQLVVEHEVVPIVVGEAWRLERSLLNLVLNASEASPTGRVWVTLMQRDHGDRPVVIAVDDDGPGFDDSLETSSQGLRGHGLEVVRRQLALLAGTVETEPSPYGGARVLLAFRSA